LVGARSSFDFVGRVENLPLNAAVVAGVVGAGVHYLLSAGGEDPTNFRRLVASDRSSEVWWDWHYLAGFERLVQRRRVLEIEGVELGQLVIGDGFDKAIEAWCHNNVFLLIKPIGADLDDLGLRLQRRRVHANNGEKLTQVRHGDGGRREATDMVGKVEFNLAFPHDRNEDGGHESVLEGSKKIVGGSRRKNFRDHMPGVPGFRCFFRTVRRVQHQEPVSEGRVRDHPDNVGYLVVFKGY